MAVSPKSEACRDGIFSSSAANTFHLEQGYMKRIFAALEGKLAGALIMTKLRAL
jgi:hypothetical protein